LAGSVYHLWLARRAFSAIATGNAIDDSVLLSAFQAGSVAPDIGFFPGGPALLSHRIHHESTADFARQLLYMAESPAENAFAAGWALHLYTDIHIHPLVNKQVDFHDCHALRGPTRSDLWHKRIEWGMDCYILESSSTEEWSIDNIEMPLRTQQDCQLTETTKGYFPELADDANISRGWSSLVRWVRRMPAIFKWTGSAKPRGHSRGARLTGSLTNCVTRPFSRLLEPIRYLENGVGLMSPLRPKDDVIQEMLYQGDQACTDFAKAWPQRLETFTNLDLDTGMPIEGRIESS
tara:strand:- start:243 stop:1118 length:876 start_codon:yes stop_codon:yes gene_type:complete